MCQSYIHPVQSSHTIWENGIGYVTGCGLAYFSEWLLSSREKAFRDGSRSAALTLSARNLSNSKKEGEGEVALGGLCWSQRGITQDFVIVQGSKLNCCCIYIAIPREWMRNRRSPSLVTPSESAMSSSCDTHNTHESHDWCVHVKSHMSKQNVICSRIQECYICWGKA